MKNLLRILLPPLAAFITVFWLYTAALSTPVVNIQTPRLPPMALTADMGITASPLVAPTITNDGGATGVTDNDATLRGEITDTGNENPTVIVYWGATDQAENAPAWDNNYTLGIEPLGLVSYTATDNFSPSTRYYYRYYCFNSAGNDWADSSANFTTLSGAYNPPTGLTLTDLGGITVRADWTKAPSANNTLVRISRSRYPSSITDMEWWYFNTGTSVNISGINLDIMTLYVSAWSELAGNYSYTYAYASIGGEGMTEISTSIDSLTGILSSTFAASVALILVLAITYLPFWKENDFLFLLAVPVDMAYGLSYAATQTVGSAAWVEGLIVAIIGTFCLFYVVYKNLTKVLKKRTK